MVPAEMIKQIARENDKWQWIAGEWCGHFLDLNQPY